jgi:Putative multicopper oxidases
MRHLNRHAFVLLCLFPIAFGAAIEKTALPVVSANDNRRPAGHLSNGVLEIHLEIREGRWYPEAEGGAYRDVYAFAEQGHDPQSSGPLIRVPKGTQIRATIRNSLPLEAQIYGLHRHPGDAEAALKFAAGETREVQFLAGEVGTYLYWATTSGKSMEKRDDAETSLSGAFVVDDPQTKKDDRILVIGFWTKGGPGDDSFLSINGKSWPYTERLSYKIGETANGAF